MPSNTTIVAGIAVPSTSPVFLTVVGVHVLIGLACVIAGAVAMLSPKRSGRHPEFGNIYFWSLTALFASVTGLAIARWVQDYQLFLFGALSFAAARRAHGSHASLAWLVKGTYLRNGGVLHPAGDRLLCRQREKFAALEGAARERFLAAPRRHRNSYHRQGPAEASADPAYGGLRHGVTEGVESACSHCKAA
jgi:hypothetical protein